MRSGRRWGLALCLVMVLTVLLFQFSPYLPRLEQSRSAEDRRFAIAWLILVHDAVTANCTELLIERLWRPHHLFVVHTDLRGRRELEQHARSLLSSRWRNVHVISTREGKYKKMPLVDIELDLLAKAFSLSGSPSWRYAAFLSGDSYPLQTEEEIVSRIKGKSPLANWLSETHTGAFAEAWKTRNRIPIGWVGWKTLGLVPESDSVVRENSAVARARAPKQGTPTVWWGTQWVFITREFARYAMSSELALRLRRDFGSTTVPDESFFQTVLYNSPAEAGFLATVNSTVADPHMFTNWERRERIWRVPDLPKLLKSGAMFTRKVRTADLRKAIDDAIAVRLNHSSVPPR